MVYMVLRTAPYGEITQPELQGGLMNNGALFRHTRVSCGFQPAELNGVQAAHARATRRHQTPLQVVLKMKKKN